MHLRYTVVPAISFFILSALLSSCVLFEDVVRAIGEACTRPSISVTTAADERTFCSGDECSLWGAIELANTCNNGMVVELAESGLYLIGLRSESSASAPSNTIFPAITGRLTIAGNGAEIIRVVRDPFERFFVIASGGDLTLSDLTLQGGGSSADTDRDSLRGGAITNRGTLTMDEVHTVTNRSALDGGAILNEGRVIVRGGTHSSNQTGGGCEGYGGGFLHNARGGAATIQNATIQENRASCGGGILNQGDLAVTDSTFRGNWAGTGRNNIFSTGGALLNEYDGEGSEPLVMISGSTFVGNQAMQGGALGNLSRARMMIYSSTISGNSTYTPCAECEDPARHQAAGVINSGDLRLRDVTLVANSCKGSPPCNGGVSNEAGFGAVAVIVAENTIIADNSGGDCEHPTSSTSTARFTAMGANLDSDSSCPRFSVHASPRLGPLQDNGGPTVTHAVLPGTPAHNAGTSCRATDQRGSPRARSAIDPCDIGAFEL